MSYRVKLKARVQDGGIIQVSAPELPTGQEVEVIVQPAPVPRKSALDIIRAAPGQRLFKTAEEVDAYIRAERDSWE